jgi:hypothetical protein
MTISKCFADSATTPKESKSSKFPVSSNISSTNWRPLASASLFSSNKNKKTFPFSSNQTFLFFFFFLFVAVIAALASTE